jgi:hypothetical protein
MTVSIGSVVQDTDYNNLVTRVRAVLGRGSGTSGYGQLIPDLSTVGNNSSQNIAAAEWDTLRTQINRCSQHQLATDQNIGDIAPTRIIGADESGTSVTRVDTAGVITWTHNSSNATMGVNDYYSAVSNIESNAALVAPTQFTLTTGRDFAVSQRTASWGGAGQLQTINCVFEVVFQGGYQCTDSSTGETVTATGEDHRRHFFNAGGDIRISGANTGAGANKGSDWAVMLANMGQVVLGKNSTTVTGTGRARDGLTDVNLDGFNDSAIGNFQLTTSYQLIFQRNGGGVDVDYTENTINIYARRGVDNASITFFIELNDNDVGDQTGTGPPVDEPVDGTLSIGLDLKRPTGTNVAVTSPSVAVADELFT